MGKLHEAVRQLAVSEPVAEALCELGEKGLPARRKRREIVGELVLHLRGLCRWRMDQDGDWRK